MLLLCSTSDKLQIITATPVSTIHVHASYVDVDGTTVTPGRKNTLITAGAPTTTDVVLSPGSATTYRNVKALTIRNSHATSSNAITIQHTDGTTVAELHKYTLLAGETLMYIEGVGWFVIDAAGGQKVAGRSGLFLRTQVLTSGTTFTTSPGTNGIFLRLVGGGGGGGGCTSVASAASAAGGGGSGAYAEKFFAVTPNTPYTYAIGALGAGSSGAAGGNGTASTFTVGATTVTAPGGTGGPQAVSLTTLAGYLGGAGGTTPTNGDINCPGSCGGNGVIVVVATPAGVSGNGGTSPFGSCGLGVKAAAAGNAASGYGAGGGGALTGASVARAGGNGAPGVIIVDEYA